MNKLVIVGSGSVGSATAQALALWELADEVVLVDKRHARADAEARDLMCSLPRMGTSCVVRQGELGECEDAGVLVFCASAPARLGQTRNDMFRKNAQIARDAIAFTEGAGFKGLYLMVSNPVDLLVRLAQDELGVPAERVVGTGTLLDTMRLEDLLRSSHGGSGEVRALAFGEHGEGLTVDWSRTTVDGSPIPEPDRASLVRATVNEAYEIMKGKGSTSYGISLAVATILQSRELADGRVLPLSVASRGEYGIENVSLSLPTVFDDCGVPRPAGIELDDDVIGRLRDVAEALKETYRTAGEHS